MPAVKITNKPVSTPGDQTHFLVTQPELPEGYAPTGQETEEELAELKVESLREIEMDDMVELIQNKFAFDSEPTAESNKPVTSAGIKAALDAADAEIDELKENFTNLKNFTDQITGAVTTSYNLLDIENATMANGYLMYDTSVSSDPYWKLVASASAKMIVLPITGGKTYTFTRKNETSRLTVAYTADLWDETTNHRALTGISNVSSGQSLARITLDAPANANYLYIWFYRSASDSDYDATLEEAMVVEGSEVFPYVPYGETRTVAIGEEDLSDSLATKINKISTIEEGISDITETVTGLSEDSENLHSLINPMIKEGGGSYNLLDMSNVVLVNAYVMFDSSDAVWKLKTSAASKTFAIPIEGGKTYTVTRKNAGSRFSVAFGDGLYNEAHDLSVKGTSSEASGQSLTKITCASGSENTYLYVFYYRSASDPPYDATIEEMMVVEGSEVLPYKPYAPTQEMIFVDADHLDDDVNADIQKGVAAYSASTSDRWASRNGIFGIEFDVTANDPSCARIANAVGLESADFDNIFPWSDMRRCNVSFVNGKKVITYEGDSGYKVDGTNGNVMVEIPAFYVCREKIGSTERWLISGTEKGGFALHPWFVAEDGSMIPFRYYGAYVASNSGDGVYSASGRRPYDSTGHDQAYFPNLIADFERNNVYAFSAIQYLFTIEYATRNSQSIFWGSVYNPYLMSTSTADCEIISAISNNRLTLPRGSLARGNSFLFYSVGMQVCIGVDNSDYIVRNITAISYDADNIYITVDGADITLTEGLRCAGIPQTTGKTDSLTTPSGYAEGQDTHVASFRYRGIENIWGTIWEILDGLRLKNGVYYLADKSHYRDADVTNLKRLTYAAPMISATDSDNTNWIGELGYDADDRLIALPTTLITDAGRSITVETDSGEVIKTGVMLKGEKKYCDAFYSGTSTTTVFLPTVGGGWDHHENGGLFCTRYLSASAQFGWLYGERITC